MPILPDWVVQVLQLATVPVFAPLFRRGHHRRRRAGRMLPRGVPESLVGRARVPVLVGTEPD